MKTTSSKNTQKTTKVQTVKTTKAPKTTTSKTVAGTVARAEINWNRTTTAVRTTRSETIQTQSVKTAVADVAPIVTTLQTLKTNVVIRTQPPEPMTEVPVVAETLPPEQEEKFLSLSDGVMQGSGIVVSGHQIQIQAPGIYHIYGNWNGSICIQAGVTDAIELRLEGVSVTGQDATPPLQMQQAGNVTITLAEQTENRWESATAAAGIYSAVSVTVQGSGKMSVCSNTGTGILCENSWTMQAGTLEITAETAAFQSSKTLLISGGTVLASGHQAGMLAGAVQNEWELAGNCIIEGGTLLLAGTNTMEVEALQPILSLHLRKALEEEHRFAFCMNGMEWAKILAPEGDADFLFSCPDLMMGSMVAVYQEEQQIGTYLQNGQEAFYEVP